MLHSWKVAILLAAVARVHCQEEDLPPDDDLTDQDALTAEQMHAMHGKIDANGDGKVSMAEILHFSNDIRKTIAKKDVSTVLEEMDHDKDGKLSLPELLKDMEQWGEGDDEDKKEANRRIEMETQKFKVADDNGDGFVDQEELPALFYPETHDGILDLTAKATLSTKDTNKDNLLSLEEFWEGDQLDGETLTITDEEKADFKRLDKDSSGLLDLEELKQWESGRFHTEEAMRKLFDIADKDNDMHMTAHEMASARGQIAGSDAQYNLMEWVEHHEL